VIATRQVAIGQTIAASDLGTVAADLPSEVGAIAAEEADALVGRVADTSIEPLELLRHSDVLAEGRFVDADSIEVALELPPARALQGIIGAGSVVDVFSTDPDGAATTVLASGVRVVRVGDGSEDDGIGASGAVRVLVSVSGSDNATRLVDASLRSDVTLVLPRPSSERAS
jgi:hypothetical protein